MNTFAKLCIGVGAFGLGFNFGQASLWAMLPHKPGLSISAGFSSTGTSNLDDGLAGLPYIYQVHNSFTWTSQVPFLITGTPGEAVWVYVTSVTGSGGHNHDTGMGRPHGWINQVPLTGPQAVPGTLNYSSAPYGVPIELDSTGSATVTYTAPEIAGVEDVSVQDRQDPTNFASAPITIGNGGNGWGLGFFPLTESSSMSLVGSTDGHEETHFVSIQLLSALQALADNYLFVYGRPLPVGDCSLTMGGLFDSANDWAYPHIGHKLGLEADIDIPTGNPDFDNMIRDQGPFLTTPAYWTSENVPGQPTHYHLNLGVTQATVAIVQPLNKTLVAKKAGPSWQIRPNLMNRGGMDATNVSITGVTASHATCAITLGSASPSTLGTINHATMSPVQTVIPFTAASYFGGSFDLAISWTATQYPTKGVTTIHVVF